MRRILPIITALAVVFSLCIVPVFAEDVQFLEYTLTRQDVFYISNGTYPVHSVFRTDSGENPVYICNINGAIGFISLDRFVFTDASWFSSLYPGDWVAPSQNPNSSTSQDYNSSQVIDGVSYFIKPNIGLYVNPSYTVNPVFDLSSLRVFSSANEAITAFSTWTPPESEPEVIPQTITIPAGYVLYFKASSDVTAGVTTNFAASNVSSFGNFDNTKFTQTYGTASALPSPGTSGDWHTGNRFTWLLDGGFLGFGSSFMTAKDFDSSNDYHYIYNPLMSLFTSGSVPVYNQALRVNFTTAGVSELYLVPLSSGGVTGDFTGFSSNASDMLPILQVDIGTDGVISTTDLTSGDLVAPVAGGDNSQYYYDSSDPSAQYQGLFSQFVNELNTIFGSVIGAFQTLINGATSFISSLGQLFSWLPSEIVTFLTSCLIVIVIAGVIKVVLP